MKTDFSITQLADPAIQEAERVFRACVHCGFCLSSCPTYTLLGDELDSPRGRIYLIKDMLENDRPATEEVVPHIDKCLSCLACQTICPSNVNYMHLIDHARVHVEQTYKRPFADRTIRSLLGWLMPRPGLFRWALMGAKLARPFKGLMPGRLKQMVALAPEGLLTKPGIANQTYPAEGEQKRRVALLPGCVQQVIGAEINDATIRLLTRLGCEVVVLNEAYCCGSITHHMGQEEPTRARMRANIDAWSVEIDKGLDAIVINASGCGTTMKDYGFMFAEEPDYAARAATISTLSKDISEIVGDLEPGEPRNLRVTYHSACSLRNGQGIEATPMALLRRAGFEVSEPKETHMCCGSAGTYNMLQSEIAGELLDRKIANIDRTGPQVIATGNIGCITQLRSGTDVPVIHTVELLDWATGGPKPAALG
ncbi:MAG: glycolate oxidase subunit GlcF [Alphaproteobacteria bacterium]